MSTFDFCLVEPRVIEPTPHYQREVRVVERDVGFSRTQLTFELRRCATGEVLLVARVDHSAGDGRTRGDRAALP